MLTTLMNRLTQLKKRVAYKWFFENQLWLCISVLRLFGNTNRVMTEQLSLEGCKPGSIGKELFSFLKNNNLNLVPWYEAHDLKHVILGYNVEPPEEMRMQAFMFGNSGFSWVITPIYLSFVIWTPSVWRELLYHYKIGLYTKNIGFDTIEKLKNYNLQAYKNMIGLKQAVLLAQKDRRSLITLILGEVSKIVSKPVITKFLCRNDSA